jgi:hypothetical protein
MIIYLKEMIIIKKINKQNIMGIPLCCMSERNNISNNNDKKIKKKIKYYF